MQVAETIEMDEHTTLGRGIELQIEVASETPPLQLDQTEFELALINMAVNAEDALPEGGRLQIRAEETASTRVGSTPMVTVRIGDTGQGIPAPVLAKVFEPFFTTKAPFSQASGGLARPFSCRGS